MLRATLIVLAIASAPALADRPPEPVEANLDRGPAGFLRLRALTHSPSPRTRAAAARALGDPRAIKIGAEAARADLLRLLKDADPGVRQAAVRALILGHGPLPRKGGDGKGPARWMHPGISALRPLLARDRALALRLRPALREAAGEYTRKILRVLIAEHDSIYYVEMFERVGLLGEDLAAEPLARIVTQPGVDADTTSERKRLIDLAAKGLGDLGYRSSLAALQQALSGPKGFRSKLRDDDTLVESVEVSIHKLMSPEARAKHSPALERIERLRRRSSWSTYYARQLAYYYMRLSKYVEAIATYKSLIRRLGADSGHYYNIACAYSKLKNANEGLKHLQLALEGGYDDLESIAQDRDLDFLREDPRYARLLARFARSKDVKPK